jgi:hypothetical protein
MSNRTIDCQTGIYDTEYTLTCHKDGSVTVRVPFIRWTNNSGSLAFTQVTIKAGKRAEVIKRFFADDTLVIDDSGCFLTLDDVIYNNVSGLFNSGPA